MDKADLQKRSMDFALRVLSLIRALPNESGTRRLKDQLFGSSSSTAANYRAACRGRSKKEFIAKLGIVIEECDETQFWLEFVIAGNFLPKEKVTPLLNEANELTAIFIASQKTAICNLNAPK